MRNEKQRTRNVNDICRGLFVDRSDIQFVKLLYRTITPRFAKQPQSAKQQEEMKTNGERTFSLSRCLCVSLSMSATTTTTLASIATTLLSTCLCFHPADLVDGHELEDTLFVFIGLEDTRKQWVGTSTQG